jgi:MerR family transcriptional regulator, redox-sensitive transcriptional activator SoxR
MERVSIGEAARRIGIRPSAIRYYESLGLLQAPERQSGWRCFDQTSLDRLRVIHTARELGFTLEEIRQLLDGFSAETPPPERWRALARAKLPAIDAAIRRATALKLMLEAGVSCRCVTVEECFLEDCSAPLRARRLPVHPAC